MIDPTAIVDDNAKIAADVELGPWCVIGPDVEIAEGCWVGSHVVIKGPTRIGSGTKIYHFCSIGEDPQDKKFDETTNSALEIGENNVIREYCSINRGTSNGGGKTTLGDNNWIMAYCHIAHDCHVGDNTVFANNTTLAGHVEIHDHVVLGGFTGVHQFCRMGVGSFSAIAAIIVKDVPPFVLVEGNTARARTINKEGLKRRGVSKDTIATLKRSYKILYRQGLTLQEALCEMNREAQNVTEVAEMVKFIEESTRGIIR